MAAPASRPAGNAPPPPASLPFHDLLSASLIVLVWGSNFVVMKIALHDVGPMLLGGLRFAAASLPLLLFVRRPALPWRHVAGYGLTQGLGQFGLLFLSLWLGMPAGVASIVLQAQAFVTVILAALVLRERTRAPQWAGLAVASIGLGLIAAFGRAGVGHVPIVGFLLCIGASVMWACSNIVVRLAQRHNPAYDALGLVVWGSLFPVVPFAAIAVMQDGLAVTEQALRNISWQAVLAVLYLAGMATVVAYSLWARLILRHTAGRIAPLSLLVPVVGLYAAWLVLDERLTAVQWLGVAVVGGGLLLNSFGARLVDRFARGAGG